MPKSGKDAPRELDAVETELDDDAAKEFTDDRTAVTETRTLTPKTVRELKYRETVREALDKTNESDD